MSADAGRKINDLWELFLGAPDFESWSPLKKPGEGKVGNLVEFMRWMDANIHIMVEIMLTKLRFPDPGAIALLQSVANDPDPKRNDHDRKLAKAILAELGTTPTAAVAPDIHTKAMQAKAMLDWTPEPEIEPEVLPAKIESSPAQHEPEDLLDVLDRLDRFNKSYRKKFDNLTEGEK